MRLDGQAVAQSLRLGALLDHTVALVFKLPYPDLSIQRVDALSQMATTTPKPHQGKYLVI